MSGGLFGRRVPVILQSEAPECGIACLAMVASYHGHLTDLSAMRLRLSPSLKGVTLKHISQVAEAMGLAAHGVQLPLESLTKLQLPAVLHWDMNHFVVLTGFAGKKLVVHDPVLFQLPSGMYSYFPTQSCAYFGSAGSSGTPTHRKTASASLWPFSGSFSSHLSVTQTSAPASVTVLPAIAAPEPKMQRTAGMATSSCLKFMAISFLAMRSDDLLPVLTRQ